MLDLPSSALFVGRVWCKGIGPSLVTLRNGRVIDITTRGRVQLAKIQHSVR